jgi:multidrug resistance efflux pump
LAIIERDIAADQREAVAAARDRALADAKNRVSIEYAESLRDVAQSQLKILQRTNQLNPGSISNIELVKAEQEVRSADLRVKQAEHDFAQLSLTGIEKEAELRVAERSLEYREIRSPIDGIVVEVHAHEGEWVRPGDPVFRVVNLSRLRVQASFDIAKCSPSEVSGRDVSADVVMTGGKVQTFTGRVAFVNPEIKSGGRFSVWAEVENQKDARGNYQLLPGMKADMTIVMNETPSAK